MKVTSLISKPLFYKGLCLAMVANGIMDIVVFELFKYYIPSIVFGVFMIGTGVIYYGVSEILKT